MTSRREFFGVLAAAPIAVPVIAKEMAENFAAPRVMTLNLSSGISGEAFLASRAEWVEINSNAWRGEDIKRGIRSVDEVRTLEGLPPIEISIPNRLYGVEINARGEAV